MAVQISSMIVAEADFAAGDADALMGLRHLDRATEVGTAAGTDAFFAGGVNEARLYDVALSADQIAALAAIGPDTGRTRIDQIQGISTLKASHDLTGMAVHGAGFVDGTTLPGGGVNRGLPDILITAADRSIFTDDDLAHKRLSYLVSGESLGTSVNLDTDAVTVGLGAMHGVGDINRDGFDDLAVATFEPGPALEGVNTFSHQVIQLFAGGDDVGARLAGGAPDFVFEPDVAQFVQSETSEPLVPKGLAFAGAGFTGGTRLITSIDLQSGNADLVGNWVAVDDAASVGGNLLVTDAADPNAAARWEFEGLDSTRNYIVRVSVTDLAALGRVPAAVSEYFIDGAEEETVVVPAGTPVDVTSPAGTTFIQLGSFRPDGDGTLKITLGAQADIPAFPEQLADNADGFPESELLGPPDAGFVSLGSATVTYDFAGVEITRGAGADFRVHTVAAAAAVDPFIDADVLVSANGVDFFSVKASQSLGDNGQGGRFASYDLGASGLGAARFIRIAGLSADAPGTGGFNLDAVEGLNVVLAGVLAADAIELTERNTSILVAEPLGSRALVYFGNPLQALANPLASNAQAGDPMRAPFVFGAATPLPPAVDNQLGISLLDADPTLGNALAFEGALTDQHLDTTIDLGDINGDGVSDLMLVGEDTAYGPVVPAGIEDVSLAAEFSIDLNEIGIPASSAGDVDGDGVNDLVFVRTPFAHPAEILVIADRPTWPRHLDAASLAEIDPRYRFTVSLPSVAFGADGASVHVLNWDGADTADVLVVANTLIDGATFGYLFSGEDITDSNRTVGVPLPFSANIHTLLDNQSVSLRMPLATDLLGGNAPDPNDIGSAPSFSARVVGDVDGDGRDEVLIGDTGFLHFQNNLAGLPDAGRVYLLANGASFNPDPATETGFNRSQVTFNGSLLATRPAEGGGRNPFVLSADATFTLATQSFGNFAVTLTAGATRDNASLGDLAADLEAAIDAATEPVVGTAFIRVDTVGDRLRILDTITAGVLQIIYDNTGVPQISLHQHSTAIWQDFSLGGGLSAVGDLNHDGFDEFAFSRPREGGTWAEGGLFVFNGSVGFANHGSGPVIGTPLDADLVISRPDSANLAFGTGFEGPLVATGGDFNADGEQDLAVGAPTDILQSPGGIIDVDDRGNAFVFFSAGALAGAHLLSEADVVLAGESDGDQFGQVALTPGIDSNRDGIDDLWIGASQADARASGLRSEAGKVYAILGEPATTEVPQEFTPLGNRQITGSGFFLVDRGLGRAESQSYTLDGGETRWFRFTTQGDGTGNNVIRLSPGAQDAAFTVRATDQAPLRSLGGGVFGADRTLSAEVDGEQRKLTRFGSDRIGVVELDLTSLLGFAAGEAVPTNVDLVLPLLNPVVAPAQYSAGVLVGEGDGQVLGADAATELLSPFNLDVAAGESELRLDLTSAIRAAFADGLSRLTIRIENPVGVFPPSLDVLGPGLNGALGAHLEVTTNAVGVLADLLTADGVVVAEGRSNLSMRGLTAGTYFLKVFNPDPKQSRDVDFTISVKAPIAGLTHAADGEPDRDRIFGGEGGDVLVGNHGVDDLFGEGGDDRFVGEAIEVRDLEADEVRNDIPEALLGEFSDRVQFQPDPTVQFADPLLEGLAAQALGIVTTAGFNGLPVTQGRISASEMAALVRLDASGAGLVSLRGLEEAISVRSLTLGNSTFAPVDTLIPDEPIGMLFPLVPKRVDSGNQVGLLSLESLSLDFIARVSETDPGVTDENGEAVQSPLHHLGELLSLRHLSLDGTGIVDPAPDGPAGLGFGLSWLTQLETLSIDHTVGNALADVSGLADLSELRVLSLEGNRIVDVGPLAGLSKLEFLNIAENAVRNVETLFGQRIIDNGDLGDPDGDGVLTPLFGETGTGFDGNLNPTDAALGGDYRFRFVESGDIFASSWSFENLPEGDYEVFATWLPDPSRSMQVDYTVTTDAPVVDTATPFNADLVAPSTPDPLAGGRAVTINTDTLGVEVDGANDASLFFGSDFTSEIVGDIATFRVQGDLQIGADVITVVGGNALSIQVSNNVFIDEGASFDLSASENVAGPGGGDASNGGAGGVNTGLRGVGGFGGDNAGSASDGGAGGARGGAFFGDAANGRTGNSGASGGTGGAGVGGAPGTLGGGGISNPGGGGNAGSAGTLGSAGVRGFGQGGGGGGEGRVGGTGRSDAGEDGGGGGKGGSGGGGSSGSGGGGGGGTDGSFFSAGITGGRGGQGGDGGLGGIGSAGTGGGAGGLGGGALEIIAAGTLQVTGAEFAATGSAGANGQVPGPGGTIVAGGVGGTAGTQVSGRGDGGRGGTGGSGGDGGDGAGGGGGGGAGGTIKLFGSVVKAGELDIDLSGGAGGFKEGSSPETRARTAGCSSAVIRTKIWPARTSRRRRRRCSTAWSEQTRSSGSASMGWRSTRHPSCPAYWVTPRRSDCSILRCSAAMEQYRSNCWAMRSSSRRRPGRRRRWCVSTSARMISASARTSSFATRTEL